MNKFLSLIRRFRLRSVFFRFYISAFVFVMMMTMIFMVYSYQRYFKDYMDTQEESLRVFLAQSMEPLDTSIMFAQETLASVASNGSVVSAVMTPDSKNEDRNISVTSLLKTTVASSSILDAIYLYDSTSETVYLPGGQVGPLTGSRMEPVLAHYEESGHGYLVGQSGKRYTTEFMVYKGEAYIVHRFIPDMNGYLAVLIGHLRNDSLNDLFETLNTSSFFLEIRARDGAMLLSAGDINAFSPEAEILSGESVYTGCFYKLRTPTLFRLPFSTYFRQILPFFAVLLIAGAFGSLLVARFTYSPIRALSKAVVDEEKETSDHTESAKISEVEMIAKSYQELRSSQETVLSTINSARPEIEAGLLRTLITKPGQDDPALLTGQLAGIGSALKPTGIYQCFVVTAKETISSTPLTDHLALQQAAANIPDLFLSENGKLYIVPIDNQHLCFVIQYADDASKQQCVKTEKAFLQSAAGELHSIQSNLDLSRGGIYEGIMNLGLSYREAASQSVAKVSQEKSRSIVDVKHTYFNSQITSLNSLLLSGDLKLAEDLLERIEKDIRADGPELPVLQTRCAGLLSVLAKHVSQIRRGSEEELPEYSGLVKRLNAIEDPEEVYAATVQACSIYAEALKQSQNNRKYRLTQKAKEYIHQHYMDCDLSVQNIADALHVSNAYLSRSFSEYTGDSVVAYLSGYRVEAAKTLLKETDLIIKDVGFRTGFNTIQSFNRVFKKITGLTPGDYRKKEKPN